MNSTAKTFSERLHAIEKLENTIIAQHPSIAHDYTGHMNVHITNLTDSIEKFNDLIDDAKWFIKECDT